MNAISTHHRLLLRRIGSECFTRRRRYLATLVDNNTHNSNSDAVICDVSALAMEMRQSVREYIQTHGADIALMGIVANHSPKLQDAELYSECVREACDEDGIAYRVKHVEHPEQMERIIQEANRCPSIDGILIYYPIEPKQQQRCQSSTTTTTDDNYWRNLVVPEKDVEGLTRTNGLYPCTALACWKILQRHCGVSFQEHSSSTTVTIINRSEILGRPLASMLSFHGVTVFSIDKNSILKFLPDGQVETPENTSLEECLHASSIIISGVPDPNFSLPRIPPNITTVMNVSEYENICPTLLGDSVQFIPQVGKVTIAALEHNLIQLHARKHNIEWNTNDISLLKKC